VIYCAVCGRVIPEDVPDHFKRIGHVRTETGDKGKWLAWADLFSHDECYERRHVAARKDTCIFE
jgi:hypothetical protein